MGGKKPDRYGCNRHRRPVPNKFRHSTAKIKIDHTSLFGGFNIFGLAHKCENLTPTAPLKDVPPGLPRGANQQ